MLEVLTQWQAGQPDWPEIMVAPDAALEALDDVLRAADWLSARDGGDDGDEGLPAWSAADAAWRAAERGFNRAALAAEMCAAAAVEPGAAGGGSVLALLRLFPEYASEAARPSEAQGRMAARATFEGGHRGQQSSTPAVQGSCQDCRQPFTIAPGEVDFFKAR